MDARFPSGFFLVAAVLALMAAPAQAATLIGSDFVGGGTGSSSSAERLFIQDAIGGSAVETPQGVITRWNLSGASGVFALELYRHRSGTPLLPGEIHADFVAQSAAESAGPGQQSFATRIPVELGDYIALHAAAGAGVTIRNAAPGEQTWYFSAAPDATSVDQDSSGRVTAEVFYQAIVEPDADGDDFGDETQDDCPSNPSTQGACPARGGGSGATSQSPQPPAADPYAAIRAKGPAVRIARTARATRRGVVSLKVTNPHAFALKGRLVAKRGRKTLARKGLPLPSRATKTLRVKLRGAALRTLRQRGRLKLKLAATLKGPVGKVRTTRASVTVAVPRRKRSPGRAPGGGGGGSVSIPEGTYTGSYTSQMSSAPGNSPLSFRVTGGQVVEFRTRVHVVCTGSGIGSAIEEFNPAGGAPIAADGTFTTKFHDSTDKQDFIYEGKIKSDGTATGKLRYADFPSTIAGGFCSGAGPWTARR